MEPFMVEVLHMDGSVTLALRGELDLAAVPTLHVGLRPLVARYDASQVVLDCAQLTFMDAAGLGELVSFRRAQGDRHGKPTLRNVNSAVMKILRITQTSKLFDFDGLADAIRHGEPFDMEDQDA